MALLKQFDHPYKPGTFDGYVWCAECNFNFANQTGRLVFHVHESADAANAGYPPLFTESIELTPGGTPAVFGDPPLVSEAVPATPDTPAVYDEQGNLVSEAIPGTAYVPAVYGEPPVVVEAVPAFNELIADNQATVTALASVIYSLALTRPVFGGATIL